MRPTPLLIYQTEDGRIKIAAQVQADTLWLTQQQMAELFQTTQQNISLHLQNVYGEGELQPEATHKDFLLVRQEGGRQVSRATRHYNLDAILSVGYRVKSAIATRFRIWATQNLREYLTDPTQPQSIHFFQTVQNKMHWAITGQTAAEIIRARADKAKPHMGLTNWRGSGRGGPVRLADVSIAKNYLNADELSALNNLVEQYLVFAQGQAMRRIAMTMDDWINKLHGFLAINDRDILSHAGKISHAMAIAHAESEYEQFNQERVRAKDSIETDFDRAVAQLPAPAKRSAANQHNPGRTKNQEVQPRTDTFLPSPTPRRAAYANRDPA